MFFDENGYLISKVRTFCYVLTTLTVCLMVQVRFGFRV